MFGFDFICGGGVLVVLVFLGSVCFVKGAGAFTQVCVSSFFLVQGRESLKTSLHPPQNPSWGPTKLHSANARITRSTAYSSTPCVAPRRYPSAVITGTSTAAAAAAPFKFEPHFESYHGCGECWCCRRGPSQVSWGASDVCPCAWVVSVG